MHADSAAAPHAARATRPPSSASIGRRQMVRLVLWGVLLWFVAAMLIRHAPPGLFGRGAATALPFAASLPIAFALVRATRRIASLRPDQLVAGAALASAAAMLCDGVALTWSSLYGPQGADLLPAAAWLLWGVGLILVVALLTARREGA